MKTYDFWDKMGQASSQLMQLSIKGPESVAELKSTRWVRGADNQLAW